MTLNNLIPLINGELLSNPTIKDFKEITNNVSRVCRGDLFICNNDESEIETALKNGAYGIIFDNFNPKISNEIAWIRVKSTFQAYLKILRFRLMPKELKVFYSDIYTLEYIAMMQASSKYKIISGSISAMLNKLWHIHDKKIVLLEEKPELLSLFPLAKPLKVDLKLTLKSISPLESTLLFDNLLYKRIKIPTILHTSFNKAFSFLKLDNLKDNLLALTLPKNFDLRFYDKFFNIKEFGKGSKTLFFAKDEKIAIKFLLNIKKLQPWIKTILFLNENPKNLSYNDFTIFNDEKALLNYLHTMSFDTAIIYGATSKLLTFVSRPTQLSLFQMEYK